MLSGRRVRARLRAAAIGAVSGIAGLLAPGCQSTEPDGDPPLQYRNVLYPGLPPVAPAATPGTLGASVNPPAVRPAAVSVHVPEQVQLAAAVLPDPDPDRPTAPVPTTQPEGVVEAASSETIDLGVALRLAGVNNPTANLAQERIREALAGRLAARSLLLPTINLGGNYRHHRGAIQDDPGGFRNVDLRSLYLGLGAGAVGANPVVIPGVRLFAHLGDAVYAPLAARQQVAARRSEAQAVQNQILLDVAVAYLNLVGAEARLDILVQAEKEVAEIARVTAEFARTGQGAPPDADRASARTELVRRLLRQAEGEMSAASARLCRLLNLDPAIQLRSPGGPVEAFRLIAENTDVEALLAAAVAARPELPARAAQIQEAQIRVRQEQVRPLLPVLSVGYSAGQFGGGGNPNAPRFGPLSGRGDFDVIAVWNIQNLGFGNRARILAAGAGIGQAVAGYEFSLNQVRREVVAAQADAQAAARQIVLARAALTEAEEGFQLEKERVRRGQGRPIEALDSFRLLLDARLERLRAVIAFDVAQFRLHVALGSDPLAGPPIQAPVMPGP